ncbi:MAG: hypothetical protein Q8M92_09470, partial [Candidatus Subteraquimicrobiales bacterium]|nr:hypothetical protein [Candidatus Subteraquimicrobiales bacterium]
MEWHINDLSLSGQFADPQSFRFALEPLLQLRIRDALLQKRLYCSRTLHECKATASYDLRKAVLATHDRGYIRLVLEWAANGGPFWDDDRQFEEDDYFECCGSDVTNQGLGEAARRRLAGREANTYSFQASGFEKSPLSVQHGLLEEPINFINIINHWQIEQLRTALSSCRVLNCWKDVQEEINRRFNHLIIAADAMDNLMASPFSTYVADQIIIRLDILSSLVDESDENGGLSVNGRMLHANHFVGEKAWFTDESTDNKARFKQEMTFSDPSDASKSIFCSFHG